MYISNIEFDIYFYDYLYDFNYVINKTIKDNYKLFLFLSYTNKIIILLLLFRITVIIKNDILYHSITR